MKTLWNARPDASSAKSVASFAKPAPVSHAYRTDLRLARIGADDAE
jgi:hypothetical protein